MTDWTCRGGGCTNPGNLYSYAFGQRRIVLCDECLASMQEPPLSMVFRPVEEVRDERPVWLRRLRPSDRTEYVA